MDEKKVFEGPWMKDDYEEEDTREEVIEDAIKGNSEEQIEELKAAVKAQRESGEDLPDQIDAEGYFNCPCCGYSAQGDKIIMLDLMNGMRVIVCPYCLTLQLPRKFYDSLLHNIESKILTPEGPQI